MLATDNHIGYNERDPVRGQDSINTFKEILQLAVKYEVSTMPICAESFFQAMTFIERWILFSLLVIFFTKIARLGTRCTK